jgi:hypothetical protein
MASFDPPWRLDPLKNIVSVGWGKGAFVAIQFHATAVTSEGGGQPSSVSPNALITDAGLSFAIFGSNDTAIAKNPKPVYHKETTEHIEGGTITSQHYTIITTYNDGHGGSGNAGGDIYVTTIKGVSYWSGMVGGTDHLGGIGDAAAFILASGWDTFSATLVDTDTSTDPPKDIKTITDVGVLIISVGQVHSKMHDPDATTFTIEVDSGLSAGDFTWSIGVTTYKKSAFDKFPVDATNEPVGWKAPVDSAGDGGSARKLVRFEIDFVTLKITRSSTSTE